MVVVLAGRVVAEARGPLEAEDPQAVSTETPSAAINAERRTRTDHTMPTL
jgi:hypothetical protein